MPGRSIACLIFSTSILVISACSNNDNGPAGGGNTDTTAPTVVSVTAVDAHHVDVVFSESVDRASAEKTSNYTLSEGSPAPLVAASTVPGDTIYDEIVAAPLGADEKTVTLALFDSFVYFGTTSFDLSVIGVKDVNGNGIGSPRVTAFTGNNDPDEAAPEIVSRSPAPNATGVAVGAPVMITFSDYVFEFALDSALTWSSEAGPVARQVIATDGAHFVVTANSPLANATTYTISLNGVHDQSGNIMPVTSWSFTTTSYVDNSRPTLVSSVPADLATHVNVNSNLVLTFSEAINQSAIYATALPDTIEGDVTWSNSGKTLTLDPYGSLASNRQYTFAIQPGGIKDLSANYNQEPIIIRFTTGSALATGSFAGKIDGDPGSDFAADPTGAFVWALDDSILGAPNVVASALVAGNDAYTIHYLTNGRYYPIAVKDTDGNGAFSIFGPDAVGILGIDLAAGTFVGSECVIVTGSPVSGVDFPLFDPATIEGEVLYSGSFVDSVAVHHTWYDVLVGAFKTDGFDPANSPDYTAVVFYWPSNSQYGLSSLFGGLADGTYYLGAFMDIDGNRDYDAASEPAGFYGGANPIAVSVHRGSDATGIDIPLVDPAATARTKGVAWKVDQKRERWLSALDKVVREATASAKLSRK